MTEVYLLFYQSALQPFVWVNKFLQLDNPLISVEHDVLNGFMRKLCCRLLSINVVKQVSVEEIDPESDDARLTDTQLHIGFSTKATVNKLTHEGYNMYKIKQFYIGVGFFTRKHCYMVEVTYH